MKQENFSSSLSSKQSKYISNSCKFLQADIIAGCKLDSNINSSPNIIASLKDLCSLYLTKLYASLNLAGQNTYKKQYKYPYNFILPNGLTDEYIVNIIDGSKTDHWPECVTDNNIISYKGNEYKFYVYYTDKAFPVKNNGVMGFTLKLTKK